MNAATTTEQRPWPVIDPADRRLFVPAAEMAAARPAWVSAAFADLLARPEEGAPLEAQLLHGDRVAVLASDDGWARVKAAHHGYVGWLKAALLGDGERQPTHLVSVPRTFLYPGPDLKLPRSGYRSMGSGLLVTGEAETRGTRYLMLDSGEAVFARHAVAVSQRAADYVSVAEQFLRTPYLWGGETGFGIDCSGLVGLAMRMAGVSAPRDSDMQAATIGEPVDPGEGWQDLRRGDLIFWRGHVAIAQGDVAGVPHVLHANGYTMDVASEPVSQAVERIAFLYESPIGVRRPRP